MSHFLSFYIILADCEEGEVRLQNGTDPSNGRVEVCQNGIWSSVCSSNWDHIDAMVVCRQLGYESKGSYYNYSNNTR